MTTESQSYELEDETRALTQEQASSNGEAPTPVKEDVEYLETLDENELRTAINNCSDVVEELVPVPEWVVNGKVVRVLLRSLDTNERAGFIQSMQKVNYDLTKLYPDLVILSTRHPVTKRLLWKPADRGMLLSKIGKSVERLAMRASAISGLDEDFLNSVKKS